MRGAKLSFDMENWQRAKESGLEGGCLDGDILRKNWCDCWAWTHGFMRGGGGKQDMSATQCVHTSFMEKRKEKSKK